MRLILKFLLGLVVSVAGLNQTALSCNQGSFDPETNSYFVQLRNPSLAGNYLGIAMVWSPQAGTPSVTASDNQGQNWTVKHNVNNTAGPINLTLLEMVNSVAGVNLVQIPVGGTSSPAINFAQFYSFEAFNVAQSNPHDVVPFDNGGSTTFTTTPSPGGLTPNTANDLVMVFVCEVSGAFTGGGAITSPFTPATNFVMRGTDLVFGTAVQWQVVPNTNAITSANMAITSPANGQWCAMGIALKSAAAGTQATAEPYMRHTQWAAWARTGITSLVQQFQSTADNIVVEWLGTDQAASSLQPMTALSDNGGSNTYTRTPGAGTNTGGYAQHGYVLGSTPGDVLVTTTTATGNLSTSVFTDMKLAHATFDKVVADNTGNQTVAGDLTVASITPSRSGGALFNCTSVNVGSLHNPVSPWNGTNPYALSETSSGNDFLHEDNGWVWISPTSTASIAPTYHNSNPSGGVLNFSTESISFLGPVPVVGQMEFPAMFPSAHALRGQVYMATRALQQNIGLIPGTPTVLNDPNPPIFPPRFSPEVTGLSGPVAMIIRQLNTRIQIPGTATVISDPNPPLPPIPATFVLPPGMRGPVAMVMRNLQSKVQIPGTATVINDPNEPLMPIVVSPLGLSGPRVMTQRSLGQKFAFPGVPAVIYTYTPSGGIVLSGAAPMLFIAIPRPAGGLVLSGTDPVQFLASYVPTGGIVLSGHASMLMIAVPHPSGGLSMGGVAPRLFIAIPRPAGGINLAGAAGTSFVPAGGVNGLIQMVITLQRLGDSGS